MAINSIEEIPTPRHLTRHQITNVDTPEEINTALNKVYDFSKDVADYMEEQYQILHNGALIRSWQVEELLASTIGAGTISVDKIYLGNDRFELDGALGQIRVKDDADVTMLEFGEFGSGTDWGIKVRNGAGSVVFSALSNAGTSMDGAIITNATLNGAALIDATLTGAKLVGGTITGVKIANSTITDSNVNDINGSTIDNASIANGKLISISADKITLSGTLACTSTSTAIDITDSGLIHFSGGGDIVMDMSGSNMNFIIYRNASAVEKGYIFLNSSDHFKFLGASGTTVYVQASGSGGIRIYSGTGPIEIGADNTDNVQIKARVESDIIPDVDSTYDLGGSTLAWLESFVDTYSDIPFRNSFVMTESDKVDPNEHRDHAIYFMKRTTHRKGKDFNWERVAKFDEDGILHVKGINIITDEWDDELDTYFEGNYDNEGDIFLLTNAPDSEPHKQAGLQAVERRRREKEGKERQERSEPH